MSKKVEEEEWEDVEEGEEEEEEEDTTINNSDVVMKYKKAATWANEALQTVINACVVGAKVGDICKLGDDTINAKVATMFKGVEKGIAFPTCVSVNHCVCHNSPAESDDPAGAGQVLALNDVVHLDLGVHVDGYCAVVAHTVLVTANGELPADSKEANIITAAYQAVQNAIRSFRPGNTLYQVTEAIERVAALYNVNSAEGVLSHKLSRYIIDGGKCIVGKNVPEHKVHNYEFEPASVWTLDIVFTTGKGKLKEKDAKISVFKAALETNYTSRGTAASEIQGEIEQKAQTFCFAVRNIENKKARLGLSELVKHNVVIPYPVLFEKEGETVAHFKVTLFITNSKIERITGLPMQKGTTPKPLDSDEVLAAIAKQPMAFVKKEKKPAA